MEKSPKQSKKNSKGKFVEDGKWLWWQAAPKPIVSKKRATVKGIEPLDPKAVECNPCFEESVGVLVCNGTDSEVIPPPTSGGPWALGYNPSTGLWGWYNLN